MKKMQARSLAELVRMAEALGIEPDKAHDSKPKYDFVAGTQGALWPLDHVARAIASLRSRIDCLDCSSGDLGH